MASINQDQCCSTHAHTHAYTYSEMFCSFIQSIKKKGYKDTQVFPTDYAEFLLN